MNAYSKSIGNVLGQKNVTFFIPPFQRSYAWGEEEVQRYFDDILTLVDSEMNFDEPLRQHFLGTVVLKEEKKENLVNYVVVDGQQRLTTTLLFIIALRDSILNADIKGGITNAYLKPGNDDTIKLKQVTEDWGAFRDLIDGRNPPDGNIKRAYNRFKALIEQHSVEFKNGISAIERLNVAVIELEPETWKGEDPQTIFETLNSLGKPLTLSDLVRNYILLGLDSECQTYIYEQKWFPNLEQILKDKTSNFLRDFLQMKQAKSIKVANAANTKYIYHRFKQFIDGYESKPEFVDDILEYVDLYYCIISETHTNILSTNPQTNARIKNLLRNIFHDVKSEALKPLVLGMLYRWKKDRMTDELLIECLENLLIYLVRRRVVGLTSGENKEIPTLCNKLDEIQSSNDLLTKLSSFFYALRIPNDREINDVLHAKDFFGGLASYSKFILLSIEKNANPHINFHRDKPRFVVEQIMPGILNPEWRNYLGDGAEMIHNEFVNNLGNIVLSDLGNPLGSISFDNKKMRLSKRRILANFLGNIEEWNREAMTRHRDSMIGRFLTTFPLPESFRANNNYKIQDITVPTIYPADNTQHDLAIGNTPSALVIDNTYYTVNTWKKTYLTFLNFLSNYNEDLFNILIGNGNIKAVSWTQLTEILQKDRSRHGWYTTLDNKKFDDLKNPEDRNNSMFFEQHGSAAELIRRIASLIEAFDIDKDAVYIELS